MLLQITAILALALVLEAERACDDAVLRESEATAYADQLVVLAQRLSAASSRPPRRVRIRQGDLRSSMSCRSGRVLMWRRHRPAEPIGNRSAFWRAPILVSR
jgi:hypothetical protein